VVVSLTGIGFSVESDCKASALFAEAGIVINPMSAMSAALLFIALHVIV
jgi:hypothetical protein